MESHRLQFFSRKYPWFPDHTLAFAGVSIVILILVALGTLLWLLWLPRNTIASGVSTANTQLSGLTVEQAEAQLRSTIPTPPNRVITAQFEEKTWEIQSSDLGETPAYQEMAYAALSIGRTGSWPEQIQERLSSRLTGHMLPALWRFDAPAVQFWVASISAELNVAGKSPSVTTGSSVIEVNEGTRGLEVDAPHLSQLIAEQAGKTENVVVSVPIEIVNTPLTPDGVQTTQLRAEKLKALSFRLRANESEAPITVTPTQIFSWLTWPTGFNEATIAAQLTELTKPWTRQPISAEMKFSDDSKKLTTFVPERVGREVQLSALQKTVIDSIMAAEATSAAVTVPQEITVQFEEEAAPTSLKDLNTIGITERIAVGTSEYAGSIPNRVFNVSLTAQRLHGSVVMPGEEFSFNQAIGDISAKTGYKSAYVIMNGRTQLGDGGGVCQVSTTLFRSVLNAGLPITRWKAHSYRVGYYEQNSLPGFDATVYAPSVDFRFTNDTSHAIAIAAYPDSDQRFLTIELWGTSDGRTSEVSNYKLWNQRPAPTPMFVDDPSLPVGKRQQVDWAASGANTSFHYLAKDKNGQVIQEREFVSVFRPWQAVYLVGTGGQ